MADTLLASDVKEMGKIACKVGLSFDQARAAFRSGAMKYAPATEPGGITSFVVGSRRWVKKPDGTWLEVWPENAT